MEIKQLYTNCLAQGTYYIESEGEVAIIDPLREIDQYIEMAKAAGGKIKYIFETHFHADFVSGHLSLSKKTGAPIVFGPNANPSFDVLQASDGETFKLGKLSIKVLHTPGHTLESTCYLLKDESGKDHAIFTGDTLFLGDVGRPDLAQKNGELTTEDLAGMLFDSLRTKIMPLANDVIVYPAHGAGSACGKNMMNITVDTLGNQKKVNYALDMDLSKADFVSQLTSGLSQPPAYFPINVQLNKTGYTDTNKVLEHSLKFLEPERFSECSSNSDCLILDVRSKAAFTEAHVPNSIFIGLDGDFAPWVGAIVKDVHKQLYVVAPEGKEKETLIRLSRVGFDGVQGFLKGGVEAWQNAGNTISSIQTIEAEALRAEAGAIFDVRKPVEFNAGKFAEAKLTPLSDLNQFFLDFQQTEDKYVYCRSGYRSLIAISILQKAGIEQLINVNGGYNAIQNEVACLSNI